MYDIFVMGVCVALGLMAYGGIRLSFRLARVEKKLASKDKDKE